MATASVTLKVSPRELQIIRLALQMLAFVARKRKDGPDNLLDGYTLDFQIFDHIPAQAVTLTTGLLQDIGMK